MPATPYLHWAATPYDWVRPGQHNTITAGDGTLHRLHAYTIDLPAHTWRRNSNAVALSCACMGGRPDPWTIPPTGGDQLRDRIRSCLAEHHQSPEPTGPAPLAFRRSASMEAHGRELAVEIDEHGTSWALAADPLNRYEIPFAGEASRRRLLIGSLDVVPTYRDDQVQRQVGWPLVELTLLSGPAPVILRGILRDSRAWCPVLDSAEDFGISVSHQPSVGFERWGG